MVDLDIAGAQQTVHLNRTNSQRSSQQYEKPSLCSEVVLQVKELSSAGCEAQAIQCDVSNEQQQQEAFDMHMQQFRRLDIAILNAGIGDTGENTNVCPIIQPSDFAFEYGLNATGDILNAQDKKWQKALDVDLTAVMAGTRLATQCMPSTSGGVPASLHL